MAQWEAVIRFEQNVGDVYFLNRVGKPNVGFVTSPGHYPNTILWRTSDAGLSWQEIKLPADFGYSSGGGFAFMDSLTGWFATEHRAWKTTDGGFTWAVLTSQSWTSADWSSFCYVPETKLLFATGDFNNGALYCSAIVSSDFGNTWQVVEKVADMLGITFSGLNGYISTYGTPIFPNAYSLFTTDGGLTWSKSNFAEECQQPTCIQGTSLFFAAKDHDRRISRSTDGGMTWRLIYNYPSPISTTYDTMTLTGCIRADACGNLYAQTQSTTMGGFILSRDSGNSWTVFGGPCALVDSRFWVTDEYIFAGSYPDWLNGGLHRVPGTLHRYRLGKPKAPIISHSPSIASFSHGDSISVSYLVSLATGFDTVQFAVHFDPRLRLQGLAYPPGWTIRDSNSAAGNLNLRIIGTTAISPQLLSLKFLVPHPPCDSVYSYKIYLDTAHFLAPPALCGNDDRGLASADTVEVSLAGCKRTPFFSHASLASDSKPILAGEELTVRVPFSSDTDVSIDSVQLSLHFDDAFSFANLSLPSGCSIADSTVSVLGLSLTLKCPDSIITLHFKTALETSSAKIYLDSAHFYGKRLNCDCAAVSVAGPDSVEVHFTGCGDSLMTEFMRTGSLVGIDRIVPNPARDVVRVEGRGLSAEGVEVYDVMGRRIDLPVSAVAHQATTPQPPPLSEEGELELDVRGLPDGMYYLRIGNATSRFVIER